MYDLIIIGAGPSGITAAVYAARQKLNTLLITENIGGQAAWSGDIENYTGFQFISGGELAKIFEEHVKKYAVTIKEKELASIIQRTPEGFSVKTDKETYESRTVIIASGKQSRKLGVPGEDRYRNKGVTYCATCDGPVFAGKDVIVVGGGNSALDAVLQLEKIARTVYVVNVNTGFTGDAIMIEKVQQLPNVTVMHSSTVKEIFGETFVKGIVISRNDTEEKIECSGIFIEIGLIPKSDFGIELKTNKTKELIIDSRNRTSVEGIFAAGDVTDIPEKQIVVAAGEGAKACLSAIKYLHQQSAATSAESAAKLELKGKEGITMDKWKCIVCGYVYDPAQNNNVPFEKLPEDWVCPECGVGKDQFEKI